MLKNLACALCSAVIGLIAAAPGIGSGSQTAPAKGAKASAETVNPADLKWGDAPPVFPKGAQLAVLHGNPFAAGAYALRLRLPDGYKIAPHWHTQDEHLTVLSGAFVLHMGDSMDANGHQIASGGYHFLPGRMHHAALAQGETVVQVHGNGPFDMHYLNPADDPSKTPEAEK
ncbi:MAG TPA: cupin domain-containing protein [Myxococcales bacterium]|jgi:hypothetical protein